jgi:pimeloyl-ACP methyl ester carboxylesterase/GNAT superfamily N-acetyltransferase
MARSPSDRVEIAHASFAPDQPGDPPAVLLIHGLGRQSTEWDPAFVHRIVAAGYRVVVMDNRDSGLSRHFDEAGKAPLGDIRRAVEHGEQSDVAYRLADMAADAARVLSDEGAAAAHIVGVSMGGYIAQELAIHHPDRVHTLTSIMSSTGDRRVGQPSTVGMRALFRAPAATPEEAIDDLLEVRRILATEGTFDAAAERSRIEAAVSRSYDPAGTGRQLAAIWASPDRTEQLEHLTVPTLVIHGGRDELVGVSGGRATAAAVEGSELLLIEGMGHDLPPVHWPLVLRTMVNHFDSTAPPDNGGRIVPAGPGDAPALAALAAAAFEPDRRRYGTVPPGLDSAGVHRDLIARGHAHALVVDRRLAGAAYVFPGSERGEWHVGAIFIGPDFQRRGLGRRLMAFVHAAHPAARRFTLETPYRSVDLHHFYERCGYRRVGRTDPGAHPETTDPDFHLLRFQRDIEPG